MNMPDELASTLSNAANSIDQNGELPASERLKIHQRMEDSLRNIHENAGYYARAKLAIACAYYSLHFMEAYPPLKIKAEGLLENAIAALKRQYDMDQLESEKEVLHTDSIDVMTKDAPYIKAVYAGLSCVAAANTSLYDDDLETIGLNEKAADPQDWEASFLSSLACCGGAVWEDEGDNQKRREFWSWYLNQAIPFAWDTESPLIPYPPVIQR